MSVGGAPLAGCGMGIKGVRQGGGKRVVSDSRVRRFCFGLPGGWQQPERSSARVLERMASMFVKVPPTTKTCVPGESSPDSVFALPPEEKPDLMTLPLPTTRVDAPSSPRLLQMGLNSLWTIAMSACLLSVLTVLLAYLACTLIEAHIPAGAATPALRAATPHARFDFDPASNDCFEECVGALPRAPQGRMQCLSVCGAIEPGMLLQYPTHA